MLLKDWTYEVSEHGHLSPIETINNIRRRAWEYYRKYVGSNFIFKLLGITGKVHKIFVEIFGEEI